MLISEKSFFLMGVNSFERSDRSIDRSIDRSKFEWLSMPYVFLGRRTSIVRISRFHRARRFNYMKDSQKGSSKGTEQASEKESEMESKKDSQKDH